MSHTVQSGTAVRLSRVVKTGVSGNAQSPVRKAVDDMVF